MKKILLVLLFAFSLFARENQSVVKSIAKKVGKTVQVGILVQSPIIKSNFPVRVDGNTIFDISINPLNQKLWSAFFYNKKFEGNHIELIVPKNFSYQDVNRSLESNIEKNTRMKVDYVRMRQNEESFIDLDLWNMKKIEEITKRLYGSFEPIHNKIKICAPANITGSTVKVKLESNSNLKSIAIFTTGNEYPTVAIIKLFDETVISDLKFTINHSGEIIIIGQGKDGKIYQVTHNIVVAHDSENINDICHY